MYPKALFQLRRPLHDRQYTAEGPQKTGQSKVIPALGCNTVTEETLNPKP